MNRKNAPPSFANRKEVLKTETDDVTPDHVFSLMSYNVLADCHTHPYTYPYRDPTHLDINFRHKRLLEELQFSDCDVICLQEVGPGYYKDTLEPEMQKLGYGGVYYKRTFEKNDEGCATFFKSFKFTLQDSVAYKFGEIAEKVSFFTDERNDTTDSDFSRYTDRCDVALVTLLKHVTTAYTVVVANTHLVWESEHLMDVRFIQSLCCLVALREFRERHTGRVGTILCGDFNSEPTDPAYALIVSGCLKEANMKLIQSGKNISLDTTKKMLKVLEEDKLILESVYKHVSKTEPKVTNLDAEFCLCLDYIFFEPRSETSKGSGLEVLSVLDFLSEEEMRKNLPPSEIFPSDHLPLIAKFFFN
ncbi:uncharacterized protein LOC133201742 [Saccostrea echinata]|uniref:uncharacterized protein LOC133201742 n=1 Tax=Saccostrea echinata TaxID=191078 RepID=UPI002A808000|nr:uncharacterized protein LOC133201742 [Saccostrea echinata]